MNRTNKSAGNAQSASTRRAGSVRALGLEAALPPSPPTPASGVAIKLGYVNNLLDQLLGACGDAHQAFAPVLRPDQDGAGESASGCAVSNASPLEGELSSVAYRLGMAISSLENLVERNTL